MNQFLHKLSKVSKNKKQRDRLINKATTRELNCVRNLCHNVCCKRFELPIQTLKKVYKFRKDIRDLANRKKLTSLRGLKHRLIQRGGFLPLLLPTLLGVVSSLASKLVGRAIGV